MAGAQSKKLFLAIGLILVAAVIFVIGRVRRPGHAIVGEMYYDLGSRELFVGPSDVLAPIEAPSGGEGVRAFVFACGQCADPFKGEIAYLVKYPDDAKRQIQALREQAEHAPPEEQVALRTEADSYLMLKRVVAPPDAGVWVVDNGTTVEPLRQQLASRCGKEKLAPCRPLAR